MSAPTLLGIPYDGGSSHLRGAAGAPPLIRQALWSQARNSWSETGVDVREVLADAGDVSFRDGAEPRHAIESAVAALLAREAIPILLGGDHSITYPVIRAFKRRHAAFDILHVDAHPDLYDELDGDRYSHACPFARIAEDGLPGQLVQVGIRTMTGHQREQAQTFGARVVPMSDWLRGTRFDLVRPAYLSIDLDALDPAFAPGVSHPEPGGLSVRELLGILHTLPVPLIGADVVEYNPRQDPTGVTAVVAAKLVQELAACAVGARAAG
jgi:agmatinase